MAVSAVTNPATFIGPAASKAGYLAGAAIGDFYLEDDTGLTYRKSQDGLSWIASESTPVPGLGGISKAYDVATTITRPANATPYTANDVVGGALDLGVLGQSAKAVKISTIQLEIDVAAIPAGMSTFTLYLYSVTPPSAVADNGAFDLPAGDRASYLGAVLLGSPADLGSTLYCEVTDVNKQVKLAGTHLFGYLVTTGTFTPAGNSEVYVLTMHTEAI